MATLRTFVFIDSLQPQLAAFMGSTAKGFLPIEGMASLFVEIAPGIAINRVTDVALKQTNVVPAVQIVERSFGLLEVHEKDKGQVDLAGKAILKYLGLKEEERMKPKIETNEVIRAVEPYQAQLINRNRGGSMLIPGHSLFILETSPAGYVAFAANEAEKAANIYIIDVRPYGAYGRLYIGGTEAEIDAARSAAIAKLEQLKGVESK